MDVYIKKMWYIYRVLFIHKEVRNYVICRKMDGTGDQNVKWSKSDSERQISPQSHPKKKKKIYIYIYIYIYIKTQPK
jgi:hypothetical protein